MKRFKTGIILLMSVVLSACQSNTTTPTAKPNEQKEETPKEALQMKYLYRGDGNEKGLYHIALRDVDHITYANIYYYDYASKKEIFLCDQPQCKHIDDSCTSFVKDSMNDYVFLHDQHIYQIHMSTGGMVIGNDLTVETSSQTGSIIQMDLDGKNKKTLCTLPEGYSFDDNRVITDERYVYLPLAKEDIISKNENTHMNYTVDSKLYRIDLTNGEQKSIMDFHDMKIQGVNKRDILLSKNIYQKDINKLLQEKKFDEYETVARNAKLNFTSYHIDEQKMDEYIPVNTKSSCLSYQDKLYYDLDNAIHEVSLKDAKDQIIAQMPNDYQYILSEIWDGKAIIQAWNDAQEYITSYTLSLNDKKLTPLTLMKHQPNEPMDILGETKDAFFVYYDHDQHAEKTWAGTDQYTLDKAYYGSISKDDFWANKDQFETFDTISTQ
ncbi:MULTISPECIES: hypothetical protein [Bacillota]|jgi:hypothetical protein|uniref:Lipoprotein n=1 Tax=Amedibacillus hominis TaxID=2897776 RepID=A0ABS9R5S4_9FIRM|nr:MULTISPECIES: hypothetical protein [Bacillota]MCH4285005.1 hypothetical protein [Amedibacillus hominis]RGB55226.1 hypothetical protein DW271_09670 [Absiella sp. AM22-9]RGB62855.1 hypothetical protein DW120_03070 [Absiella sp. AM10-20]RGB63157.1 hypothetical protein DW113_18200 [Absiella sp. AM09-45]RGB72283.1 hypothetical protein DW114_18580 [Absiella sp. AM09-50]